MALLGCLRGCTALARTRHRVAQRQVRTQRIATLHTPITMRVVCYHSEPCLPTTYRLVQARTIGKRVLRACGSGADLASEWRHETGRSHVDDRLVSARMPAGEVDGDAALLVGLSDVDACSTAASSSVRESVCV